MVERKEPPAVCSDTWSWWCFSCVVSMTKTKSDMVFVASNIALPRCTSESKAISVERHVLLTRPRLNELSAAER